MTRTGGTPAAGVKVGLYLQPVHSGGPIAADPPQPIATVTTGARGAFTFTGLKAGKRYFVFPIGRARLRDRPLGACRDSSCG